ncbi:MAG: hypothetical protein LBM01_00640 [Christensenellaceae bacterium]|jgi:hypothetical protein|nr:hypothetical protein [Christensenellaceae bacterium]
MIANELLEEAAKVIDAKSVKADYKEILPLLRRAVLSVVDAVPEIEADDVDIYLHGSYANKTNIFFQSKIEVIVEVKETSEFNPRTTTREGYDVFANYFIDLPVKFGVDQFRELLFTAIQNETDNKAHQEATRITIEPHGKLKHIVEVMPAFSFSFEDDNRQKNEGVLVADYEVGANFATFPKLHQNNGDQKDKRTNGNFKKMVRAFKTLYAMDKREFEVSPNDIARGYFIECLLFNVPDVMFLSHGDLRQTFLKVLNYLNNADLTNFVCQNLVWSLWGETNEFWTIEHARKYIRSVIELDYLIPEDRATLL